MKFSDLFVGQEVTRHFEVTEDIIQKFAEVSTDHNPVHLDDAYAAQTTFEGRIAHGMLSAGYISSVIGNDLPGQGSIYMSQSLNFARPVRPNDTVAVNVRVTQLKSEKNIVYLDTRCFVQGKLVLEGEAKIWLPDDN